MGIFTRHLSRLSTISMASAYGFQNRAIFARVSRLEMSSYLESLEPRSAPSEATGRLDGIASAAEWDRGAAEMSYLDGLGRPNLLSSDSISEMTVSDASDPSVGDAPVPSSGSVETELSARKMESPRLEASDGSDAPSDGSRVLAIVPVTKSSVEFASGLLGAAVGLAVGGPLFAAMVAAAANYVSRGDGDANEAVKNVARSALGAYNSLARLDGEYEILRKAKENVYEVVKSNENVDEKKLENLERSMEEAYEKLDIVDKGGVALRVVGDLVEKTLDGVGEINSEYKLTEKAISSINQAIETAKSQKS